jgi:hypothetical protein
MVTVAAINRTADSLRTPPARVAGVFYVLTIVLGIGGFMLERGIVASSDATATATNILAHPDLFRLSFVANLLGTICYVVVTALFYELFRPVNRSVSLVASFISLVGCAMGAVSCGLHLVPPVLLSRPPYASAFLPAQLHTLALLFVRASGLAYSTAMILFGFYCVLIGYLTFRSTFLPRIVGTLFALAGVGWLTFLLPSLGSLLSPVTMLTGLIGEGSLGLWLLIKGVDVQRWQEKASAAA